MRRRGFVLNSFILILLVPLLLLLVTYEDVSYYVLQAQADRISVERLHNIISQLERDFSNAMKLSSQKAILVAVEYAITNTQFFDNASRALSELIVNGTIEGSFQDAMKNITISYWVNNTLNFLKSQGYFVTPSSPNKIVNNIELYVYPLDSFHIVVLGRVNGLEIRDLSGKIIYNGSIPQSDYVYSIVAIDNMEDPFISTITGGGYSRVIVPCNNSYPMLFGSHNVSSFLECVRNFRYFGSNTGPSFLERLEGSIVNHEYYIAKGLEMQKKFEFRTEYPVGLVTFLVPDRNYDDRLYNYLLSVGVKLEDQTSSDYYFLKYYIEEDETTKKVGYPLSGSDTNQLLLDCDSAWDIFNTTNVLIGSSCLG
ncbi:hypothetical protein [Thermococcus sp. PK]|uniref:hypothetical protein n=1 Tax=Thermococcus sp. PK TaxID=913025 RepID=UPI0005B2E306|nr:hypothetical protein [Thermococcus sp. PK]